jgi:hypothetical protein
MDDTVKWHICDKDKRRPLHDARGIFCCYVCDECEEDQRAKYRPDIFTDPNYWHDEPIDDEDE